VGDCGILRTRAERCQSLWSSGAIGSYPPQAWVEGRRRIHNLAPIAEPGRPRVAPVVEGESSRFTYRREVTSY
jgi:hypothetical protein